MRSSVVLLGVLLFLPAIVLGQARCKDSTSILDNCNSCQSAPVCFGLAVGAACGPGQTCNAFCTFANKDACCRCSSNKGAQARCTTNVINASTVSVVVQASEFPGLQFLGASTASNLSVVIPLFALGTTAPVTVFATKLDSNVSGVLALSVCSEVCRICDPVITLVTRLSGKPETQTFTDLPAEENRVMIENGNPGLTNLVIKVNGTAFRVPHLDDQEKQTIDISSAMFPGNGNVITFTALGKPGATATVVIRD